jgi:hypothetical protein
VTQPLKSLIKFSTFTALLAAVVLAGAVRLAAQNAELDFKLVNKTGVNIASVYIGPHDADEWGDDVMEGDILRDGEEVDLTFHPKAKAAMWDLRIEDKAGEHVEWENLDLTKINVLTIKIVNGKAIAEWK